MLFPHWNPITAEEVASQTFKLLKKRHSFQTIHLLDDSEAKIRTAAHSLVADDSHDHHIRRGFMTYLSIEICRFGFSTWLLSYGTKTGSYPGKEYAHDILVLRWPAFDGQGFPLSFDQDSLSAIRSEISIKNSPLSSVLPNSLVRVMSDGRLQFQKEFGALIELDLKEYMPSSEKREGINVGECETASDSKITCSYRRDFPRLIADYIGTYLKASSFR